MELESRQTRCKHCGDEKPVLWCEFHCLCGYTFNGTEVQDALSTSEIMRRRLVDEIYEMEHANQRIGMISSASVGRFVERVGYESGKVLGSAMRFFRDLSR